MDNRYTPFSSVFLILLTFLLCIPLERGHAQMFSVADPDNQRQRTTFSYTTLSAGWERADFVFTGPANTSGDRYGFTGDALMLRFENPGIDMYMGVAGKLTGMDDHSYLNIGANLFNDFVITGTERFWLMLPLQIRTSILRSQPSGAETRFQMSSFQGGAGLGVRAKLSDHINFSTQVIPSYGFSFSQGQFFGGRQFTLEGSVRLYIDNLIGERGLVFGYDYEKRSYDIDADLYDYDFSSHSITLGITF